MATENDDLVVGKVVGAVTVPILLSYGTYSKLLEMVEQTGMDVDMLLSVMIRGAKVTPGPGKVGISLSCNKRLK